MQYRFCTKCNSWPWQYIHLNLLWCGTWTNSVTHSERHSICTWSCKTRMGQEQLPVRKGAAGQDHDHCNWLPVELSLNWTQEVSHAVEFVVTDMDAVGPATWLTPLIVPDIPFISVTQHTPLCNNYNLGGSRNKSVLFCLIAPLITLCSGWGKNISTLIVGVEGLFTVI